MSSHLIAREDMTTIAHCLYSLVLDGHVQGIEIHAPRSARQTLRQMQPVTVHNLFALLNRMNADALQARYGDDPAQNTYDGPAGDGHGIAHGRPGLVQLYKLMQSYLYQCNEGNIPERPEYQALRAITVSLAATIVEMLPEYKQAKWA